MSSDASAASSGILVEAEAFYEYGGWVLDSQFETQMGSPYLLAHGLGRPVVDARTTIVVPLAGQYTVWVRSKDWVPSRHPGRFTLSINGTTLGTEFGANGRDWSWQSAGVVDLSEGDSELALHDLTGFDGRCDAIFLSRDGTTPPDGADESSRTWRRRMRGLPDQPAAAGDFDVVVVGGGVPGCAAALTAARLGCRVALIQDRPYLGGNASVEIGITPQGEKCPLILDLAERTAEGDLRAAELLAGEPHATIFLEHTVFDAATDGTSITSVDARDARSGWESRFRAPVFIDCTGKAVLGLLTGAETLFGQESRAEFGEGLAPENRVNAHHGHTVFFRTRMAESPVAFPDVPWARDVAKDFANLNGQLVKPGVDNGPGPVAGPARVPDPSVRRRMLFPASHFWEYGQWLDPYTEEEHIRDHLLCAIYGTFSNVKRLEPDTYANLELEWVAHVAARGEYRRYLGDYILTETDIRSHQEFPDAVVYNSGAFCLHYAGDEKDTKYDFRLKDWKWDTRDGQPYEIPFRCLYSATIPNLMMAGKHISVTHVAGGTTKFMANGAHHAIATAAAAFLCTKYVTTPRGVYEAHLAELQEITGSITGKDLRQQRHASAHP